MSPTTTQKVKRRASDRREIARRQAELDASERDRKQREVDLAVDFRKIDESRQEALEMVAEAETRLGSLMDELIRSGSTYQRCEVLVGVSQEELRRLRSLARQDEQHHDGSDKRRVQRADPGQRAAHAPQEATAVGGGRADGATKLSLPSTA